MGTWSQVSLMRRRSPPEAHSVASNAAANIAGQILVMVPTLVATHAIYHDLGSAAFGLVYFTLTISLLIVAGLDLGMSSVVVRETARGLHNDNPEYVRRLIGSASVLYWCLYAAAGAAAWISAPFLVAHFLNLPSSLSGTAVGPFRILTLGALLALPRTLYAGVWRGMQRLDHPNLNDVVTLGVQQAGVVILVGRGYGLLAVAWWIMLTFLVNVLGYIILVGRALSFGHVLPWLSVAVLRGISGFGGRMIGISVLGAFHTHTDKIVAARLLPIDVVGAYAVTAQLLQRATIASGSLAQAALPALSVAVAKQQKDHVLRVYRHANALTCIASAILLSGATFAGPIIYAYALDEATAQTLVAPTGLLAIGYLMNAGLTIPYMLSLAVDRADIALRWTVIALLAVTPVTVLLIVRWGIVGAALSWVWYNGLSYGYTGRRVARECMGVSPLVWIRDTAAILLPPTAVNGAFVVVLGVVHRSTSFLALPVGALSTAMWLLIVSRLSSALNDAGILQWLAASGAAVRQVTATRGMRKG